MYKEYPLNDVSTWYSELLEAVAEFEEATLQHPTGVGFSETTYRQINILVNQEKQKIFNDTGENPSEDDFIEIGSVSVGGLSLEIWTCEEFPNDKLSLMTDDPDGDDGEPYADTEEEEGTGRRWRRAS